MLTLLNAPILTSFGTFNYEAIKVTDAKALLRAGFTSYIGHQSTCDILSQLLEVEVPLHRGQYEQQTGDQALIFRLKKRIEEGQVLKTREEIEAVGYEFGLITKIKNI